MNKGDFLTCLSGRTPYSRDEIKFLLEMATIVISEGLELDGQVKTPLGIFKVVERKARNIVRIDTRKLDTIPAKKVVKFKPAKELEGNINGEKD
jgi:nucleoid DNA-binding protein